VDRATKAEPMVPVAPALLSTITVVPSDAPSRCAMARPRMSVVPPGG